MKTTETQTVPVFPQSTGEITLDAAVYRGVSLDRMDVTGPRGGRDVMWRAASKRDHLVASWSHTRKDAAE